MLKSLKNSKKIWGHFRKKFRNFGGTIFKTPLQCFDKNQIFGMIKQKYEKRASWASKTLFFTDIYEKKFQIFLFIFILIFAQAS